MAESALIDLLPYQRRWLADRSRFKAAMVTRQGGKTKFMAAIEVVEDCLEAEALGGRARWIWLSRGERQAAEAMEEGLKPLCKVYGATVEALDYLWEADSQLRYKATEIMFRRRGSRITALPSNPDTARGFTANVVLDEFAIHQDSRKIWGALFPAISRKELRLRVLSTPNGKDNKFYELISPPPRRITGTEAGATPSQELSGVAQASLPAIGPCPICAIPSHGTHAHGGAWSRHVVDIYQAAADGLDRDLAELRAACGDDEIWAQEYELKFLDEATAWLSYDLITAVEHADAGKPEKYAGNLCVVGNDIAARGDLWVAWVWEIVGDVLWTREVRELGRASFAEHDAAIAEIMNRYRVARLVMDQTGMGEKPVEDARRRYPGRVEGVLFSAASKLALASAGKAAFENRKVRIPEGDVKLRADLHKLKKVVGPTGIPRFVAESDRAGHADRAWAAFMGIAAADPGKHPEPAIFLPEDEAGEEAPIA
jgi:phage FluMu gp28-like protein